MGGTRKAFVNRSSFYPAINNRKDKHKLHLKPPFVWVVPEASIRIIPVFYQRYTIVIHKYVSLRGMVKVHIPRKFNVSNFLSHLMNFGVTLEF